MHFFRMGDRFDLVIGHDKLPASDRRGPTKANQRACNPKIRVNG